MTNGNGAAAGSWWEILRRPFAENEISLRPQLWCGKCRDAQGKCCGQTLYGQKHELAKCSACGQQISTAHLHLSYVGHADVTGRLLEADPKWSWRPMYRQVDPEIYKLVLAAGDPVMVAQYLNSCPPQLDEFGGLWIWLVLHDDDGNEHEFPGYGDAQGKAGPNGRKELIGDAIRNAAMRRGVALALWSKADKDEADKKTRGETPETAGDLFDRAVPANGKARRPAKEPEGGPGINPEVQALADLAWTLLDEHAGVDDLRVKVHDVAQGKRFLQLTCDPQRGSRGRWEADGRVPLSRVITFVKNELTRWHANHALDPAAKG